MSVSEEGRSRGEELAWRTVRSLRNHATGDEEFDPGVLVRLLSLMDTP
ncbi:MULTISPECIES: hypothetical protein [unclassified Arthrobacter]|nr:MULTISPECIES: hypothetical protein [unclassified Arthrobacter]